MEGKFSHCTMAVTQWGSMGLGKERRYLQSLHYYTLGWSVDIFFDPTEQGK